MGYTLDILGGAQLRTPGGETVRLERRTAALLAHLALEGPTARSRLCGLLWPESPEATARNNLRQLVHRLKRAGAGDALLTSDDPLALAEGVAVDAVQLEQLCFAGRHPEALALDDGALLSGFDYADCEELEGWLAQAREGLAALRRQAVDAEVERLEGAGELAEARALAERQLARDGLREEAYRRLMRLHFLAGDRAAALDVSARCARMLQEEYGAAPMPETVALTRELERGGHRAPPAPRAPARRPLPLSVLRPPVLAGREDAWRELEEGYAAGQFLYLEGEAGAGKSRLALDFAASKGRYARVEFRPGDAAVPHASNARAFRRLLTDRPDVVLPDWVRRELVRMLPELARRSEPAPAPLLTEGERLRFYDAQGELLRLASTHLDLLVVDDVHYCDAGSVEAAQYYMAKLFPFGGESGLPYHLDCGRAGELSPAARQALELARDAGMVRWVGLAPLTPEALQRMLEGLELPGALQLAPQLMRYTGGNPLFVVETLKHLVETGALEKGWPARLPPPGKVRPLIQRRLERLSPSARTLAQVAALAGADFGLELAAEVMELRPLSLSEPLWELASAQVVRDGRFTHDLVAEAVREGLLPELASLFHRRLAHALEGRGRAPTVVGQHWLSGGERDRALPYLTAGAKLTEAAGRPREAAELWAQVVGLARTLGRQAEADEARAHHAKLARLTDVAAA